MAIQSANKDFQNRIIQYFSDTVENSYKVKQAYIENKVLGLSVNLPLFVTDGHLNSYTASFIETTKKVIQANLDNEDFQYFVVQVKDEYLFIRKHDTKIEDISNLPFCKKDDSDNFPSIFFGK